MKPSGSSDFDTRLADFLSATESRSGEAIAAELGCSRTAVWKHIEALRNLGIAVDAVAGRGYRLQEPLELLSEGRIREALDPEAEAGLHEIIVRNTVDSTNDWLQSREPGEQAGVAVFAERQTAGRGRRGQSWVSPFARNIYLSLGWSFESGVGGLGCLPLLLALSACDALDRAGLKDHTVKWPNDLRHDRRKLGGCLVEVQGDVGGPCLAVLGVGINVRMPESVAGSIDQPWKDVAAELPGVSRNSLAGYLLNAVITNLDRFAREGFMPFMAHWERRDELAGAEVELSGPAGLMRGIARGISERGGLLLQSGGNVQEYLSGEAHFVRKGILD